MAVLYRSSENSRQHSRLLDLMYTCLHARVNFKDPSVFLSVKPFHSTPRRRSFLRQFAGHDRLSSVASNEVLLALCHPHSLYGKLKNVVYQG